ncbi:hypothetical protein PT300_14815 [Enterobacteriaceae bacterium ESL0689]|nr:hypothetical protein [Enterobacteriaceae bacterium ESL0689]
MRKRILLLICFVSGNALSAMVELGFENEQYNHHYNTADVFMPYVATNFSPLDDSKLNISMKYMYQNQYGKKHATLSKDKFKTNRDRIEMYAKGYSWKFGDYTLAPELGFRYEAWDIDYSNTSKQDKRKLELRFFPNMNYKITKNASLYMNGFIAPVFMQTKQESRKSADFTKGELKTNHYNGDYYQELQVLGVKYTINDNHAAWSSIYNERKHQEYASRYDRWQLRLGYNFKLNDSFNINPYIRYDLYYKETNIESSASKGLTRDKDEQRYGTTFNYIIHSGFSLTGEVYWQTAHVENYQGVSSEDKNRMFYKLGIRKNF